MIAVYKYVMYMKCNVSVIGKADRAPDALCGSESLTLSRRITHDKIDVSAVVNEVSVCCHHAAH